MKASCKGYVTLFVFYLSLNERGSYKIGCLISKKYLEVQLLAIFSTWRY